MIVEIEYYKGDIKLFGAECPCAVLEKRFAEIEKLYDREEDNFVGLFCFRFGFKQIVTDELPDLVYDRDIGRVYTPRRG